MQAKQIPQTVDPNLAAEEAQAKQDNINQLQTQANQDTTSLMARYGTHLAISNVAAPGAPSVAARPGAV